MRAFEYAAPKERQQALGLLGKSWGDTEILAGGTDLLSLMKDDILTPKRLVNIKGVAAPDLHAITRKPNGVQIGALVNLARLPESAEIRQRYPMLADAAVEAASPQIRNMATLGGNLCQRPRCWYFRNGNGLLATDKNGKSLVTQGDNRYHAILGNDGPAYFVSPSTVAPVLIAYRAKVHILGIQGTRELPLEKFFVIPTSDQEREHDLKPTEIVTEIIVPPATLVRAAQYEVRQKEAFDWPYATAAVALTMNGSTIESARVVLGHVAPIPWLSAEAAQVLKGKTLTPATAEQAAQAAVSKAKSLGRNAQKIHMAKVAVKRAILKAGGVA